MEFDAKMLGMDFDENKKTIVEKTYALARRAHGNSRPRVGASFTTNPYFV